MVFARFATESSRTRDMSCVLDQARLNIENRSRTSRLPWKGQFSPDLIKYLMDTLCPDSRSFLDPFCGSGTVLFESQERGSGSYGAEVNPAAWHLASLASFGNLPSSEKKYVLSRLKSVAAHSALDTSDMFNTGAPPADILHSITMEQHPFLRKALASVVLLGMGDKPDLTHTAISRGAFAVASVLTDMKPNATHADCYLSDARCLPITDASIEAAITSPPYINVFNYHQNYRNAAELLGWKPLEAARSEVGSNRKHRMNRFLTVVQYCMDMAQAIAEMRRVLRRDAPIIIVVGRTSNVLGASFQNSAMIYRILGLGGTEIYSAERMFTNRYGERIYEDILVTKNAEHVTPSLTEVRAIGMEALTAARREVPEKNRSTLEEAITRAKEVSPSPFLSIGIPQSFSIPGSADARPSFDAGR